HGPAGAGRAHVRAEPGPLRHRVVRGPGVEDRGLQDAEGTRRDRRAGGGRVGPDRGEQLRVPLEHDAVTGLGTVGLEVPGGRRGGRAGGGRGGVHGQGAQGQRRNEGGGDRELVSYASPARAGRFGGR